LVLGKFDEIAGGRRARSARLRIGEALASFAGDRNGAMILTVALMMTSFAGIAALSVDLADWYSTRRAMQSAVDAAALGGALRMLDGDTSANIKAAATTDGNLNTVGMAANGTTLNISVNMNAETVTATMTRTADLLLSGVLLGSAPTIAVTAVAGVTTPGGTPPQMPCLLVTAPTGTSVTLEGSSSIQASGCPVHVNSTSASAISLSGNTTIKSSSICGPGGHSVTGSSSLSPAETTCAAYTDRWANLTPPSNINSPCNYTNYQISNNNQGSYVNSSGTTVQVNPNGGGTITMSPGVYCGGMNLAGASGTANVVFQSGIYIVKNGQFETGNNTTATGTGVGFWLTGTGGANISNNNGSTNLTITAPTSGAMAGISIYQDQTEPTGTITEGLAGNSTITFTGMLYFGNQNVTVSGSSEDQSAAWTSMVAYTLLYNGYSTLYLNSNYSGSSVPVPTGATSTPLVALLQ
jgi:Flp pilus assembly protein TadG